VPLKSGRPCGPGKAGADAPAISLRLRFLSGTLSLRLLSLLPAALRSAVLQLLQRFPVPEG